MQTNTTWFRIYDSQNTYAYLLLTTDVARFLLTPGSGNLKVKFGRKLIWNGDVENIDGWDHINLTTLLEERRKGTI